MDRKLKKKIIYPLFKRILGAFSVGIGIKIMYFVAVQPLKTWGIIDLIDSAVLITTGFLLIIDSLIGTYSTKKVK